MTFDAIEHSGETAVRRLDDLRAEFPSTGKYPFLIGDDDDLRRLRRSPIFPDQPVSQIIAESFETDVLSWFRQQEAEDRAAGYDPSRMLGYWPDKPPYVEGISLPRLADQKDQTRRLHRAGGN